MNKKHLSSLILILSIVVTFSVSSSVTAQGQPFDGYSLYCPNDRNTTYLIDMDGTTVHSWYSPRRGGYGVYLLENGHLLRPARAPYTYLNGAAKAGLIQEIDWDGTVLWEFEYNSQTYITHHDVEPMPNGNVLLVAWEVKTAAQASAAGRRNAREMWPDHIVEVEPTGPSSGNIVWEWHAWDHLIQDYSPTAANYGVVGDHPELIDINLGSTYMGGDWMHVNGISYNPDLDQIVISSHFLNEFYVIDHSTTTAQAAGHTGGNSGRGGDILYRWGNPSNYDAPGSRYFDVVHCSIWVPRGYPGAGNIMAFNNGSARRYSEIVEITAPMDSLGNYILVPGAAYGPAVPNWSYSAGSSFYSNHLGSCQRLPNGNTYICEATSGDLFEVDSSGNVLWNYNYSRQIAKSYRYARDYPGVAALSVLTITLTPTNPPIQIPSGGGNFLFQGIVGNTINTPLDFDVWTEVVLPNGNTYGPLIMRSDLILPGGGTILRQVTQSIPGTAPAGTYHYRGHIGNYPAFIDDSDEFSFVKLPGDNYEINNFGWNAQGWDDEIETVSKPLEYSLLSASPNPFNQRSLVSFTLQREGYIELSVYDIAGREMVVLTEGFYPAGGHQAIWDASGVSSGVYFARLTADESVQTLKLLLVK